MTAENQVAGGVNRTVSLVCGKRGWFASIDGAQPVRLPQQPKGPVSAASLLKALGPFSARYFPADTTVDALLIGTCRDGTPGIDGIDITVLNDEASPTVRFTALSEAQALHMGYLRGTGSDLLVFTAQERDFEQGVAALQGDIAGVNGYMIFATIDEDGSPRGSLRCWKEVNGQVVLADVWYLGAKFGQIYTLPGGTFIDQPVVVASLMESFLEANPDITRVFMWSQDGLAAHSDYVAGGKFWNVNNFRPMPEFAAAGGQVVVVATAFTVATLSSAAPLPQSVSTPVAGPTEADDNTTEGNDGA